MVHQGTRISELARLLWLSSAHMYTMYMEYRANHTTSSQREEQLQYIGSRGRLRGLRRLIG